mgnify:CR=1 FL=1
MPFVSMVVFMLKWTAATIPAMILIAVVVFALAVALGGLAGLVAR